MNLINKNWNEFWLNCDFASRCFCSYGLSLFFYLQILTIRQTSFFPENDDASSSLPNQKTKNDYESLLSSSSDNIVEINLDQWTSAADGLKYNLKLVGSDSAQLTLDDCAQLSNASIVIGGGRAFQSKEKFDELLKPLARKLNAASEKIKIDKYLWLAERLNVEAFDVNLSCISKNINW